MMEKLKGITVRIDGKQREFLTRLRDEGISHSFIVRRALNDYIAKTSTESASNPKIKS